MTIWNKDENGKIADDGNPLLNAAYRVQLIRQANRQIPVSERPPVPKPAVLLCDALDIADAKLEQADRVIGELGKSHRANLTTLNSKVYELECSLDDAEVDKNQLRQQIVGFEEENLFTFIMRKLGW